MTQRKCEILRWKKFNNFVNRIFQHAVHRVSFLYKKNPTLQNAYLQGHVRIARQVTSLHRQTTEQQCYTKNFPITCCERLACPFTWCAHDPLAGKYSTAPPFIRGGATFNTTHPTADMSNFSRRRVATVIVGWFAGLACKNVISVTPNCSNDCVLCIVYIQLTNVATSWETWPTAQRCTLHVLAHYVIVFVCL